jgi:hypothetical protein
MTMLEQVNVIPTPHKRLPWNKGKLTGAKPPLRPKHEKCWSNHETFFWKIKFAQCRQLQNSIVGQKFEVHTVTLGDLLYAIQTCNLCSCRYVALRLDTHCVCSKPTRARRVQ